VNKDFFKKSISLKDIDFKKIKNKKEIVIGILILAYIIVIICIGKFLLDERETAKIEFDAKESRYNLLKSASSAEELKAQIDALALEKEKMAIKVSSITNNEFNDVLADFKKKSPIVLSEEEVTIRNTSKELEEYSVYNVTFKSFSGSLEQMEEFLKYVDEYERIVRIDTFNFKKNQITGNMGPGSLKLSFYFKKMSE